MKPDSLISKKQVDTKLANIMAAYVKLTENKLPDFPSAGHIPALKELKRTAAKLRNKVYDLNCKINETRPNHECGGWSISLTIKDAQKAKADGFELAFEDLKTNAIWSNLVSFVDDITDLINELKVQHQMPILEKLPKYVL